MRRWERSHRVEERSGERVGGRRTASSAEVMKMMVNVCDKEYRMMNDNSVIIERIVLP